MLKLFKILNLINFQGVTKRMKISRRVVANDGTARKEEKVISIFQFFISIHTEQYNFLLFIKYIDT